MYICEKEMAQHIPKECIGNIYKPLKSHLRRGKK